MFRLYKLSIVFVIIICLNYLQGENSYSELYSFYESKDFTELQKRLDQYKTDNSYDIKFFKALFYQDGEQAKKTFEAVYNHGKGKAKYYSAKKMMDYYYARGYYVNAAAYQKYLVEHNAVEEGDTQTIPESKTAKYYIQVGAFSLKENAEQQVRFLKIQNINSIVVDRNVDSSILYCVWIPGNESIDETLVFANEIKQKYALDFQIKKK